MVTKQLFNKWFSANYYALKEKCICTNLFGEIVYLWQEDIFHNTYLTLLDSLKNEEEEEFEEMFVSSFRLYTKRAFTAKVREIVPEETFWKYQKQTEEETEEDEARKEAKQDLAVQILATAKKMFSKDELIIFKLYYESGLSFQQIGELYGVTGVGVGKRYNALCSRLFSMFNKTFISL